LNSLKNNNFKVHNKFVIANLHVRKATMMLLQLATVGLQAIVAACVVLEWIARFQC